MANIVIEEYITLPVDPNGNTLPMGSMTPVAVQEVTIGGSSAASTNPLNKSTRYVIISSTGACRVRIGSGSPTALATDGRILSNSYREFGISSAENDGLLKVACITDA